MNARNVLAAGFLALLGLPAAVNLLGGHGANAEAENRRMAGFPRLEPRLDSVRAFPAAFDAWFQDDFGLRGTLVRWSGEIKYFGLGVSPSATVVRGADGWLYDDDDFGMVDYVRASPFSREELETWRETLSRSRAWLAGEGIAFAFVIAPDKHVVYPEHLPPTVRPVGKDYRMDELFRALGGSGVPAIDLRPALLAAKGRERLFEKTDTHWNERGAFAAYRELVGALREQAPSIPPAKGREEFDAVTRDEPGMDLAGMIGLRDVLREERLLLVPRAPRKARTVEPAGGEPWWGSARVVTEIPGSTLPRAVVFRDSFVSRLAPFLSEHFSRVVYVWQDNFDADLVRQERPDVVVQEIVGRHLHRSWPYSSAPAR